MPRLVLAGANAAADQTIARVGAEMSELRSAHLPLTAGTVATTAVTGVADYDWFGFIFGEGPNSVEPTLWVPQSLLPTGTPAPGQLYLATLSGSGSGPTSNLYLMDPLDGSIGSPIITQVLTPGMTFISGIGIAFRGNTLYMIVAGLVGSTTHTQLYVRSGSTWNTVSTPRAPTGLNTIITMEAHGNQLYGFGIETGLNARLKQFTISHTDGIPGTPSADINTGSSTSPGVAIRQSDGRVFIVQPGSGTAYTLYSKDTTGTSVTSEGTGSVVSGSLLAAAFAGSALYGYALEGTNSGSLYRVEPSDGSNGGRLGQSAPTIGSTSSPDLTGSAGVGISAGSQLVVTKSTNALNIYPRRTGRLHSIIGVKS